MSKILLRILIKFRRERGYIPHLRLLGENSPSNAPVATWNPHLKVSLGARLCFMDSGSRFNFSMNNLEIPVVGVDSQPGRDGKIFRNHRQDGNDEVHRI